ncbi:MAG TPA: HD-GYP domain-containing protein [Bacillota bacterium]|nr:HD-GYP domain-containing protein [Bacillota bacterium]
MRKIRIEQLEAGMILAKSIYGTDGRVLVREQTVLNPITIERLRDMGFPAVYIKQSSRPVADLVSDITRVDLIRSLSKLDNSIRAGKKLDLLESRKSLMLLIDEVVKNRKEMLSDFPDIRMHSDYLYGHSVNVSVIAVKIGLKLGYNELKLSDLAIGTLFHDIGMTQIPLGILNKTAPLNTDELDQIRKHPENGFKLLKDVYGISAVAANVAYQHHERFDGTGYPRKLVGKNILEFARIVAVADVFDALTTEKVYRSAISSQEALICIKAKAGSDFDPEIVELFEQIIG